MHYKNGREAKNGDKVVYLPQYGQPVVGVLCDATAGNNDCNGMLVPFPSVPTMPDLKNCLRLDDVLEHLKSIPQTK